MIGKIYLPGTVDNDDRLLEKLYQILSHNVFEIKHLTLTTPNEVWVGIDSNGVTFGTCVDDELNELDGWRVAGLCGGINGCKYNLTLRKQ